MTRLTDAAADYQRRRWTRTNAHLYIRHDAWRVMPPGAPRWHGKDVVRYCWPEPLPPRAYERKYDPDRPRVGDDVSERQGASDFDLSRAPNGISPRSASNWR